MLLDVCDTDPTESCANRSGPDAIRGHQTQLVSRDERRKDDLANQAPTTPNHMFEEGDKHRSVADRAVEIEKRNVQCLLPRNAKI